MKKHYKHLGIVYSAVALAVVCVLAGAQASFADPQGGDSDSDKVGGCKDSGTNCTSWGITWVKQPLDEFLASAERVGLSEKQKQDMIAACAGMADPYVIRQAYVDFANGGKIQFDSVSGLIANDVADRNNAIYVDPSTIPGGLTVAEAQALFEYALSIGVDMEYAWEKMAIFSFDEAWTSCGTNAACISQLLQTKEEEAKKNGDGPGAMPYFQSKTIIDVGDGIPEGPQDSGWDGHVTVEFSTDESDVAVSFNHTLQYVPNGFSIGNGKFTTKGTAGNDDKSNTNIADVVDTVNNFTPYTITTGGGGNSNRYTDSGGSTDYSGGTEWVHLEPGETKTVCSYINYNRKFANMKSKTHVYVADNPATTTDESESHLDWYLANYSGSGSSGACATITRPSDPGGTPQNPNPGAGNPSGVPNSNIMYAGESTTLQWDINAPTYEVRRLMERQITAHLVDVLPGNEGRFFNSSPRSANDPYGHYSGRNIVARHNFGEEGANLNNSPNTYSKAFGVVVPDYVGYKYCHSGGYRYESWYSINGNWKHDTRMDKPWRNYWYVYNASCRVIAKKPTVVIWNGSILSAGGVTTASSTRYDNAVMGNRIEGGGSRTLYGAWTEYLAAIGRNVNYFASGSSLAIGSKTLAPPKSSPLDTSNSSLTIANKNRLGSSGIVNNSTYRTRLTTFLENQAVHPGGNTLGAMTNVANTQILSYDGDLKITGNITTQPGDYTNIYNIPQVVIFVHGNLEIASDVTRIDAWLIVDGKINTCSEFTSGSTESDAVARLRDNYCTKQLAFNGPVMASGLTLNRSFGSDHLVTRTGTFGAAPTKWNAGEVFNLRMDSYLWAYAQAGRYASSYTESYTRELAPRY